MRFKGFDQGNLLEGMLSYVTYKDLGGRLASSECIISELSNWPLDGILGFLASLSIELVQNENFFDPPIQGGYLNLAIVDDFPAPLPGVSRRIVPGRVPDIGRHRPFIHEHNLAWLSHHALMHSIDGQVTEQLEYNLRVRTCRLLLMVNDLLVEDVPQALEDNLAWRQEFVLSWLRRWQFNIYQQKWTPWIQLARQSVIMLDILPEFFDVETDFVAATNGITLKRYYEILVQWLAHIYHGMSFEKCWINRSEFGSQLEAGTDELNFILSKWSRTLEEYRDKIKEWRNSRAYKADLLIFDYVPLLETPLIEARRGELICPVIPFLLRKIVDEPYFILSNHLSGQRLTDFHGGLARAYEKYANSLVERIAKGDLKGRWIFKPNPKHNGEEFADAYLQRDNIGVSFEHKGHRLPTDFLLGGGGDRVIGPSDQILELLDTGQSVDLHEGKNSDEGLITLPMWQQSLHADNLRNWANTNIGLFPEKIYSVITHLANVRIDHTSRIAYLNPLIESADLYTQEFLEFPQWLHISDLEALASLADNNNLDLESLLYEKTRDYSTQRFDIFLQEKFNRPLLDNQLLARVEWLINSTKMTFWPSKRRSIEFDS